MATLSECLSWTGQPVTILPGTGDSAPVSGIIVHAFPTPFDATQIDLAVRLKKGGFTVVMASARGIEWDFATDWGKDNSDRKSA
jgi:hypothetical protein